MILAQGGGGEGCGCAKWHQMGSIIGHRINYNGVCVLRGQWYIVTKK